MGQAGGGPPYTLAVAAFKLIHSRWWSALAFWASTTFMGLLLPIAVSACLACMAIANAIQSGQVVQRRRFGDAIDEFPGSFNADARCHIGFDD